MPVFGVREVRIATPRTRLLTIDFGDHTFTFMAGQAVLVGLQNSTNRRPYSIASSPQQALRARAFELLVQVEDSAAPEPHLELATAGSQLVVDGPFGSFNLPPHISEQHVLFIAGGTGIAPLRSMLWDVIERRAVDDLTLIYSARTASELAYQEELSALAKDGLLHLQLTTTRDATSWSGRRGRVDETLVRSMLRTTETRCLVCGPPPLVADAIALLRQAGVSAERILTESYAG